MKIAEEVVVLQCALDFGNVSRLLFRYSFHEENVPLPANMDKFCFPEENLLDSTLINST